MLPPQLKKKVDALWNRFWSAGITNPLVAVEQITYLLFLKRLETLDNDRVRDGKPSIYTGAEDCRWSYIKHDRTPQHLLNVVFPWLRELERKLAGPDALTNGIEAIGNRMSDAYFQLDPNKGGILSEAIDLIDGLFDRVDTVGATADIMGDTFEYLLSEIASAGKNGQFRTPRHIIRFMIELLDPQPGDHVIDPAAGTGGFLFSTLSYILKQHSEPENLRVEWDGTPHRTFGERLAPEQYEHIHNGSYYVGLDNDRTMVRIGWMNLILHGIDNPQIHQRDSLSQRKGDDPLHDLLQSERYDRVFANPPYTGTVDTVDLERSIFPAAGRAGRRASEVITNKSELLFIWTMLDLLRVGGRCAVIVPEGVLFGSTEAHIRLRRELLTEHLVEAIISLPAGVFQPYAGVKTSILVFQKETRKEDRDKWKPVDVPRTQSVWFYEVTEEGYSRDAKRTERRGENNDLWDALEKFQTRYDPAADALVYYQPNYEKQRWRMVDQHTLDVFADEPEVLRSKDHVAAIHELFADLPADPQ
jgi:type I restriction enzyme M protein